RGLLAAARQRLTAFAVRRRQVEVERPQQAAADVPDLVAVAPLDDHQAAPLQAVVLAVYQRIGGPGKHEQPLVGPTMAIGRIAFGVAWRDHHLSRLRAAISERDA